MHDRRPRSATSACIQALPLVVALAFGLAACGAAATSAPTPSPTPRPTPTPIIAQVGTPADAATIVIASDPRFAGAIELTSGIIGASKWWKAEPVASGGYRIELTIGWGDCPAGCINRHVWTFNVDAMGGLTLISETGDPLPSQLPT
jgi:hypothetical protein